MNKVLIVDDAAFMRKMLRLMLEKHNFEVVGEAENGCDALKKISLLKPDIVSLDITMPIMDGIQCLIEINKMECAPHVIMITAMGQQSKVLEAVSSGARGFIVKPYQEDDVIRLLNSLTAYQVG